MGATIMSGHSSRMLIKGCTISHQLWYTTGNNSVDTHLARFLLLLSALHSSVTLVFIMDASRCLPNTSKLTGENKDLQRLNRGVDGAQATLIFRLIAALPQSTVHVTL